MKRKHKLPPRDAHGRFRKHAPLPPRNSDGTFRKRGARRVLRVTKKQRHKARGKRAPRRLFRGQPKFNLCYAADRQDFYDTIKADYGKLLRTLPPEQASALRVRVDVIGKPRRSRRTKAQRKSKRTHTAFIGERNFKKLGKLRRWLLLETGYGKGQQIDWTKEGMCQYEKTATIVIEPETPRQRTRVVKRYRIGE